MRRLDLARTFAPRAWLRRLLNQHGAFALAAITGKTSGQNSPTVTIGTFLSGESEAWRGLHGEPTTNRKLIQEPLRQNRDGRQWQEHLRSIIVLFPIQLAKMRIKTAIPIEHKESLLLLRPFVYQRKQKILPGWREPQDCWDGFSQGIC